MKKFFVGIKGIVKDEKRGFLLLKKNRDDGGFWDVAGGRINDSENFEEALLREFSEELPNVKVTKIGDLLGAHRLAGDIQDNMGLVLLYFAVEAIVPEEITLSPEHDEYLFVKSAGDIPEQINEDIRLILINELNKK